MSNAVIIVGTGVVAKTAFDIYLSNDVSVYCFLSDDTDDLDKEIGGVSVLGKTDEEDYLNILGDKCDVFVGSDEVSWKKSYIEGVLQSKKVVPNNAFHKGSYVSSTAQLGHGNLVSVGAQLNAFIEVGSHNIFNTNTVVDVNSTIGSYVQLGTGTVVGSDVEIGDEVFVGSGVTIVAGVKIKKGARIGAGSVVVSDVEEGATVFGNPAKKV